MNKKLRIIVVVVALVFLALICCGKEKKLPTGIDTLGREDIGELKELILSPVANGEATFCHEPATGLRPTLMFGNHGEFNTRTILKFKSLPDTNTIESAKLVLSPSKIIGQGAEFIATMHLSGKTWNERKVSWAELGGVFEPELISEATIAPIDTQQLEFIINPNIINGWISEKIDTVSFYLDTPNAEFVMQVFSRDATLINNWPKLEIIHTQQNTLDTLYLYSFEDATLINFNDWQCQGQLDKTQLRVGNGAGFRSLVKFEQLPANIDWKKAIIHQANLIFSSDSYKSELDDTSGLLLGFSFVTSKSWHPDSLSVDSTIVTPQSYLVLNQPFKFSPTIQLINFTSIIQEWAATRLVNNGILIRSLSEGLNLDYAVLYTSTDIAESGPRLKIIYSLPASPRF